MIKTESPSELVSLRNKRLSFRHSAWM